MKIRLGFIALLLLTLTVLVMRNNERILDAIYSFLNPIKQRYIALTEMIESEGESYLMQKKTIDTLRRENLRLRQKLLEQARYLEQLKTIYDILPQLQRYAPNSVIPVHAISYVKLNSFSRIVLTKPDGIDPKTVYGLIENDTVVGIARLQHRRLHGYLLSDPNCRFAVYVGDKQAPGIAEGIGNHRMTIKYIPKWYDIKPGDSVVTSGLDRIFFANLLVGTVENVRMQSAYKTATVRTFADTDHPKIFFLIKDVNTTLFQDQNDSFALLQNTKDANATSEPGPNAPKNGRGDIIDRNETNQTVSEPQQTDDIALSQSNDRNDSLSSHRPHSEILQTRDDLVQPEPPIEHKPQPTKRKKRTKKRKSTPHRYVSPAPLDLF